MENRDVSISRNEQQTVKSPKKALMSQQIGDFACSFTRINRQGSPVLLACISVCAQSGGQGLPALLHHAEEINVRLPLLKVSIRSGTADSSRQPVQQPLESDCMFVLHGLFCGKITAQSMSEFLNDLTQDFQKFLAYVQTQNIQLKPSQAACCNVNSDKASAR